MGVGEIRDTGEIEIHDLAIIAIEREFGYSRCARYAVDDEAGDVILERLGCGVVLDVGRIRSIVIGVINV